MINSYVLFQNLCERAGVLTAREIEIVDAKNKHLGHADGRLHIDGIDYLLEIKTVNARGFASLHEPKEGHKMQTHAYMKSIGLQQAVIIYMNKDTSMLKEFVIPYDEAYYQQSCKPRIVRYFHSVKNLLLPEKEGTSPSSFPCSYCAHKRICYDPFRLNKWLLQHQHENKNKPQAPAGKITGVRPRHRWSFRKLLKVSAD